MGSRGSLWIALCCLFLVMLVGAAVPATAAPPPRPLCDACGETFEETADDHGVTLTVEHSTASVSVHEDGGATWVVRNQLDDPDGVARLRTNATLRDEIADRAMWDTELRGVNVSENGTITMRYHEPAFAERSAGGAFHSGVFTERYGYRNLDGLGADRLVVTAPEGTSVGRATPGATVSDDGRRMTMTELDEGRIVTFVPDDTAVGPLLSLVAVGSLVGPLLVLQMLTYVAIPTAVFALLVGAVAGGLSWLDRDGDWMRYSPGENIARLGVLATGLSVLVAVMLSPRGGSTATLFGGGFALAALGTLLSRPGVRAQVTYRTLVGGALLGTLVAVGLAITGALLFGQNGLTRSFLFTVPFLTPVFALLPAGYALGQGDRRRACETATLGFVLGMLPLLPVLPSPFGLGLIFVLVTTAYAAIIAVVGAPLLVVGRALTRS